MVALPFFFATLLVLPLALGVSVNAGVNRQTITTMLMHNSAASLNELQKLSSTELLKGPESKAHDTGPNAKMQDARLKSDSTRSFSRVVLGGMKYVLMFSWLQRIQLHGRMSRPVLLSYSGTDNHATNEPHWVQCDSSSHLSATPAILYFIGITLAVCLVFSLKIVYQQRHLLSTVIQQTEAKEVDLGRTSQSLQDVTAQLQLVLNAKKACENSLIAMTNEQDTLKASASRLKFERDNFKDSLRQIMKKRGTHSNQIHFCDGSDILDLYVERERQLHDQLDTAIQERESILCQFNELEEKNNRMKVDLEGSKARLLLEKQRVSSFRARRDLYMKFAKTSSAQKKALTIIIADLEKRRSVEKKRSDCAASKLRDAVMGLNSQMGAHFEMQQRASEILCDTLHMLNMNLQPLFVSRPFHADILASIRKCSALAKDISVESKNRSSTFGQYVDNMLR